jgi:hypothetical protein
LQSSRDAERPRFGFQIAGTIPYTDAHGQFHGGVFCTLPVHQGWDTLRQFQHTPILAIDDVQSFVTPSRRQPMKKNKQPVYTQRDKAELVEFAAGMHMAPAMLAEMKRTWEALNPTVPWDEKAFLANFRRQTADFLREMDEET